MGADVDLLVPFGVVWVLALLLVVRAVMSRETFGVVVTCAGMLVIALPALLGATAARVFRGRRDSRDRGNRRWR